MRRREFLWALGSAAATWPLAVRAQQTVPLIGFLRPTSAAVSVPFVEGFRQGLKETGLIEGQNVAVEYRYADNQPERMRHLAAELIRHRPAVIVAASTGALAVKSMTTTIPVVFAGGGDPIKDGLVTSLNQPGGNVTGVTFLAGQLGAKRLELLRQLTPKAAVVGVLVNPNTTETETERKDVQVAAQSSGLQLVIVDVSAKRDIETAFETFTQRGAGALLVGAGSFTTSHHNEIVALAARHKLPAIYGLREFVDAGGLMSYGTSVRDAYRQSGVYAGRIVRGEKPAQLPVLQAAKFEFVLNLKTAKTLGLEIHPQFLATADEVIE